jgi:hypothetical protein
MSLDHSNVSKSLTWCELCFYIYHSLTSVEPRWPSGQGVEHDPQGCEFKPRLTVPVTGVTPLSKVIINFTGFLFRSKLILSYAHWSLSVSTPLLHLTLQCFVQQLPLANTDDA